MKPAHSSCVLVFALHCTAALICALILGISAEAQIDRAELEGTVRDSSGAVVAGASVKVVAVATGISSGQPTNTVGYYRIPGLAVGRYTVTVSSTGFKTTVVRNVILEVGETHTQDIELAGGAASRTGGTATASEHALPLCRLWRFSLPRSQGHGSGESGRAPGIGTSDCPD